jgi:hypothetical protein
MVSPRLVRFVYFVPIVTIAILLVLFQSMTITPGSILAVFLLLYVFFASIIFILLHFGIELFSAWVAKRRSIELRRWRVGVKKAYYIASVVAFAPVCLIALQSLGQLQFRDFFLVALLTAVATLYIVKRY